MIADMNEIRPFAPKIEDLIAANQIKRVQEEHEVIKQAMAEWVHLIQTFFADIDEMGFMNENGLNLSDLESFRALKDSVSE